MWFQRKMVSKSKIKERSDERRGTKIAGLVTVRSTKFLLLFCFHSVSRLSRVTFYPGHVVYHAYRAHARYPRHRRMGAQSTRAINAAVVFFAFARGVWYPKKRTLLVHASSWPWPWPWRRARRTYALLLLLLPRRYQYTQFTEQPTPRLSHLVWCIVHASPQPLLYIPVQDSRQEEWLMYG